MINIIFFIFVYLLGVFVLYTGALHAYEKGENSMDLKTLATIFLWPLIVCGGVLWGLCELILIIAEGLIMFLKDVAKEIIKAIMK